MPYQNITCIINPSSGKDEPILGAINTAVKASSAKWKVHVSLKEGDIAMYVESAIEKGTDLVIIYGGDGSVMEAARALYITSIPLLILPGGTANVISKELLLPQNSNEILTMLNVNALDKKEVDMGQIADTPFLLRVNFGILADMIKNTPIESKQNFGQLAYGLTAASNLQTTTPQTYTIELDNETVTVEAVGVMVTNMGSVGIGNLSLNQNISNNDGLLDVIVLQSVDLGAIFSLAASTLTQSNLQGNVQHYQSATITIKTAIKSVICDDEEKTFSDFTFNINKSALTVLTPKKA